MSRVVLILCLLLAATPLAAVEENPTVIHFDSPKDRPEQFHFEQRPRDIEPEPSDVEMVHYDLMSNDLGERWALITFHNSSSGQRVLKDKQVVAVFADGARAYARNLDHRLDGGERFTQAVFFGFHKFPIVDVKTR